jgi:hypothetical protein
MSATGPYGNDGRRLQGFWCRFRGIGCRDHPTFQRVGECRSLFREQTVPSTEAARLTCPECGVITEAEMPNDACLFFFECPAVSRGSPTAGGGVLCLLLFR